MALSTTSIFLPNGVFTSIGATLTGATLSDGGDQYFYIFCTSGAGWVNPCPTAGAPISYHADRYLTAFGPSITCGATPTTSPPQVVCVTSSGSTTTSQTESALYTFLVPPTTMPTSTPPPKSSNNTSSTKVGIGLGVPFAILVCAIVAYLAYRIRKRKQGLGLKDPAAVQVHAVDGMKPENGAQGKGTGEMGRSQTQGLGQDNDLSGIIRDV